MDEKIDRRGLLVNRATLLDFYYKMLLIRRFEEAAGEMYARGKIGGYCHLYTGEEAIAVGAFSVLRPDDYIVAPYREHGHALARGLDPKPIMAELFGKTTGLARGKGGSMHLFDVQRNFLGGDGIVGGQLPLAAGVGFAVKYRGGDQVVVCLFGDGAINQGSFHEAMNIASLWGLPIIFMCENNQYAYGTPVSRASASIDLSTRAKGYNMRIDKADGMDVLAMREVMDRAVRYVRDEKKPSFVEAYTYRYRGHSVVDPEKYRKKEDVAKWKEDDPLVRLATTLRAQGDADDKTFEEIEQRVDEEVQAALKFAEESPDPALEELYQDIYVNED